MTSSLPVQRLTDGALWARVARQARCADSGFDPDQWYPVSIEPAQARHEAAAAIAVCASCPVRAQCLELSLRHWDIGQHGVWGGLIATDRAYLRRRWPAGHRRRRGTVVSGMIVRPLLPAAPLGRVQGGHARQRTIETHAAGLIPGQVRAPRRPSRRGRLSRRYPLPGHDYQPWRMRTGANRT